jgi:hypothetical protein
MEGIEMWCRIRRCGSDSGRGFTFFFHVTSSSSPPFSFLSLTLVVDVWFDHIRDFFTLASFREMFRGSFLVKICMMNELATLSNVSPVHIILSNRTISSLFSTCSVPVAASKCPSTLYSKYMWVPHVEQNHLLSISELSYAVNFDVSGLDAEAEWVMLIYTAWGVAAAEMGGKGEGGEEHDEGMCCEAAGAG